ncbi:aldo/keto reductase [Candidatus Omnitrophota bacterium]
MSAELLKKICLGTAQFGSDYGIANLTGQIAKDAAAGILEYAYTNGIDTLDTAYAYGSSEEVIGQFIENNLNNFKIISKLSILNGERIKDTTQIFEQSLAKLKIKSIYGYLIHHFKDFLENDNLWSVLIELKQKQQIEKIGFSIYRTEELKIILDRKLSCDLLQVPYSIFDRRFEDFFPKLKERGIAIHVRSVFLQGLAFLDPAALPDQLSKAQDYLRKLRDLSVKSGLSVNALCLNFALLNPDIDKVIIGVDCLGHLQQSLASIQLAEEVGAIYEQLAELAIKDQDLILPDKWNSPTKGAK